MGSVTYGNLFTLHDDGQVTFSEGVTAEDRGDTIELFAPGAGRSILTPEGEVVFGDGGRRESAVRFMRDALTAAGVLTTHS